MSVMKWIWEFPEFVTNVLFQKLRRTERLRHRLILATLMSNVNITLVGSIYRKASLSQWYQSLCSWIIQIDTISMPDQMMPIKRELLTKITKCYRALSQVLHKVDIKSSENLLDCPFWKVQHGRDIYPRRSLDPTFHVSGRSQGISSKLSARRRRVAEADLLGHCIGPGWPPLSTTPSDNWTGCSSFRAAISRVLISAG